MIAKDIPVPEHFVPVKPTKEPVEFIELRTIDLAKYDNGPEARQALAEELHRAMTTDGFFNLINHGLSEEEITRQVDIGHHIITHTPGEEKKRLKAPMVEEGSYHGFKPRGHWRAGKTARDKVENFNLYRDMTLRGHPSCIEPWKPEIQDFIDYIHKVILFKVLRLFAIALRIEDEDFFVKLHDYDKHDESYFRYMEYYDDYTEEEKKETEGMWLGGHQDLTSVSLLFSQPMTSLQTRGDDANAKWKFIKHIPGGLIVNAGEIMLWWTGDYFKAAIHRVLEPPKDQRGHSRCSVFYFCLPNDNVVLNTLLDESPVLREAGVKMTYKPEEAPTSKAWANARIKITGRTDIFDQAGNTASEKVGNATTRWFK